MASSAQGSVEIAGWDENPYEEVDGERRLTSTTVRQKFFGDINGEGSATWLTSYLADGTAEYAGFQRIVGSIRGREGSILLRMATTVREPAASGQWSRGWVPENCRR